MLVVDYLVLSLWILFHNQIVNNLIIKIELLYEIKTHLLGNHDHRTRRDLR